MDDLIARIRAAIDEDEQWALACNLPYQYADEGSTAPATGVHWRWVVGENWDTAVPDPVADEFVGGYEGGGRAHLATVEEWPVTHRGDGWEHSSMMPRTYVDAEEVDSSAGGHIIRHGPARVLRDVAKDRAVLDYLEHQLHDDDTQEWLRDLLLSMARAYGVES